MTEVRLRDSGLFRVGLALTIFGSLLTPAANPAYRGSSLPLALLLVPLGGIVLIGGGMLAARLATPGWLWAGMAAIAAPIAALVMADLVMSSFPSADLGVAGNSLVAVSLYAGIGVVASSLFEVWRRLVWLGLFLILLTFVFWVMWDALGLRSLYNSGLGFVVASLFLGSGFLAGGIAARKGRSATAWFWLGLLIIPVGIVGSVFLRPTAEMRRGRGERKCPHCGEWIAEDASSCPYCFQSVAPAGVTHSSEEATSIVSVGEGDQLGERLKRLTKLRDEGVITAQEHDRRREDIIDEL